MSAQQQQQSTPNYIIFDTDLGADDAWALLMLLRAEKSHNLKILAITCVNGNGPLDNVAINVLRILEIENRFDIPIYKGAHEAIIPHTQKFDKFHGNDGFGDLTYDRAPDMTSLKDNNAINAIYELISEKPNQITLICVGPLTNIGLGIKCYADFSEKVKDIFIMGGNVHGIGNINHCAEFNFFTDPEAAYIVLNNLKCPITILPWEACMRNNIDITMNWRFDVLGNIDNDLMKLLNKVDASIFLSKDDHPEFNPCDAILSAVYLCPEMIITSMEKCKSVSVELSGRFTRGQTIIDRTNVGERTVTIVKTIDSNAMKKMLLWTAKHTSNLSF